MPVDTLTLRWLETGDHSAWSTLWDGYCRFYETELSEEVTQSTWRRLLHRECGMFARVAVLDGAVVGFTHSLVHGSTWKLNEGCYLEDLFVDPAVRRRGVARALLDDLVRICNERGYARLYWHTHRDNATARALYDQFVSSDPFVRYRINL